MWPFKDRGQPEPPRTADGCPVDHASRAAFLRETPMRPSPTRSDAKHPPLSTDRVVSSIPRLQDEGGNWIYPSQAQFFRALEQKQHNPSASDMTTVVPIHNAVNERAWRDILSWERDVGAGDDRLNELKLVSFMGKPGEPSPRARLKALMGYNPPFDRHDWLVDRNGTRIRYIIDFYTGHSATGGISFYLDARPALDSLEGVRMRSMRFVQRIWRGHHVEHARRSEFERARTAIALATAPQPASVPERQV